jgi:hypothetical protein
VGVQERSQLHFTEWLVVAVCRPAEGDVVKWIIDGVMGKERQCGTCYVASLDHPLLLLGVTLVSVLSTKLVNMEEMEEGNGRLQGSLLF